ncbi:septum formation family protein [Nakamurella sp.]|uniref:septum formation family protein n=1 Tax=Nakamurella sp. TaxID=1869182 RepID=UPI003784899F
MTRRAWGVVVLAVVIIAAVVGPPALGFGPGVAGSAVRVPIAGPPAPGDCLTSPPTPAGSPIDGRIAIAAARTGTCADGMHAGEIVSVDDGPTTVPTGVTVRPPVPDPNACGVPVRQYLGWTAQPWNPVLLDAVILLGPDAGQVADGQRWIACALSTGADRYAGSVRDGFGPAADRYGHCQDSRVGARSRVSCADPHDVEVFGTAVIGADDQAGLDASCTELITAGSGMADPTAGGRLAVRVAPDDPNTVPPDVSAGGQVMTCALRVVGDSQLVASVVGVGDRPLPWR